MNSDDPNPFRHMHPRSVPASSAEIGSILRKAREKAGKSIEVISHHTRIPRKYLEALEENRLEEFAAIAYLRGFLRSYCEYLAIDFDPLWEKIAPKAPPPDPEKTDTPKLETSSPSQATWFARLSLPVAILAAIFLWKAAATKPDPIDHEPKAPAAPLALRPLTPPVEPVLVLSFTEDAWVDVTIDGEAMFKGRVPRGTKQTWKGKKYFLLETPAPESFSLTLNGEPLELPEPELSGGYRIEVH